VKEYQACETFWMVAIHRLSQLWQLSGQAAKGFTLREVKAKASNLLPLAML
jgi:hypothetical protein